MPRRTTSWLWRWLIRAELSGQDRFGTAELGAGDTLILPARTPWLGVFLLLSCIISDKRHGLLSRAA